MTPLEGFRHLRIEQKIIADYANSSVLRGDKYLFDQIQISDSTSPHRVSPAELVAIMRQFGEVVVLFDRHPNNFRFVAECLQQHNLPLAMSGIVDAIELSRLLECDQVDMYVTTVKGDLLAIACHEDPQVNGVRQIWASSLCG